MPMHEREAIDRTIETVAVRRLGVVATTVASIVDRDREHGSGGIWYQLFVRETPGGPMQLLARRRTKAELLTLVSTAGPERLREWPPGPRGTDTLAPHRPRGPHNHGDRPRRSIPRRFRGHGGGWRVAQLTG